MKDKEFLDGLGFSFNRYEARFPGTGKENFRPASLFLLKGALGYVEHPAPERSVDGCQLTKDVRAISDTSSFYPQEFLLVFPFI